MHTERLAALLLLVPSLLLTTACGGGTEGGGTSSAPPPGGGSSARVATIAQVGEFTACRRTDGGTVECWGSNSSNVLGANAAQRSDAPVEVAGLTNVAALTAGATHVCALASNGEVTCWGGDYVDVIGDGKEGTRRAPPTTIVLPPAVEIAAGAYQTCARTQDARVYCWGSNLYGEAGGQGTASTLAPTEVPALAGATSIHLSGRLTCARIADATLRCFGQNPALATASVPGSHVDVSLPARTVGIAASWDGLCVRLANGTVQCAGTGASGALGDGTRDTRQNFAPVEGVSDAQGLYATVRTICALAASGSAKCWGERVEPMNAGDVCRFDDHSVQCALRPAALAGISDAVAVTAAHRTLCVEHAKGGFDCFGDVTPTK